MPGPIAGSTTPLVFTGRIDGTAERVSRLLVELRAALQQRNHPMAEDVVWELVLAELLNNVVEHALDGIAGGEIGYWLHFSRDGLSGRLTDQGSPMPDFMLPEGAPACIDGPVETLPEGGFGWNLIRRLTVRLDYRRIDGANRLEFTLAPQGVC